MKTPQWTAGKNFDDTGAFGPWFVTPDEIPAGAEGLTLQTRLNGQVVQNASTSDMIFGVAETISLLSTFMTLEAGDVLVMRSEEHTSELQSLMRISYAVFCLKKNINIKHT